MSKKFSVEVGCKRLPNSKKLVCDDGLKRTPLEYKKLKKERNKKNKLPSKGGASGKGGAIKYSDVARATSFMPRYPIAKATRDKLTADEVLRARAVQGARIYHMKGMKALKEHLDKYLKDYKLEKVIDEGLLLSKGGKGRLFFRGSNLKKVKDIITDLKIVTGGIKNTKHYKNLKRLAEEAIKKFGKGNVDAAGHSLGGAMSYSIGQDLDIPSLSFNPLIASNVVDDIGPQNLAKNIAREFSGGYGAGIDSRGFKINAKHQILRTVDDPVSMLLAYSKLPANARIDTIKGDLTSLNPVEWHYLTNFYKEEHENLNWRDKTNKEMRAAIEKHRILVKKFGELLTLEGMKKSVKKGLTLKEHMAKEDRGDLTSTGKFGDRPVKQYYELWRKAGGKLSDLEATEIRRRGGNVRKSNVDSSLDEKTKAFETRYTREILEKNIRTNGARMRNRKDKNAMANRDNEKKMLSKVKNAKDIELTTLRKQYDQRVKPSVREVREFPDIDKIKKGQQEAAFKEEARALRRRAKRRIRKTKEKDARKAEKRARQEAMDKVRRLIRRKQTKEETLKKAFGKEKLEERGIPKKRAANIEEKLVKARKEQRPLDDFEETKEEEPPELFDYKSAPFQRRVKEVDIEANARGVMTRDDEASAFLNKSKAERRKQLAEFQKKEQALRDDINAKEAVPREGPSFKRAVQDELRANLKLLPASILASYGTNALFKALDPDGKFTNTIGGQATEGGVSGLATAGIMSGLGMDVGGALGVTEFGVGAAVGQVASNAVTQATYTGLRQDGMSNRGASTIAGAAGGATFAATSGATAMATRAAGKAISNALATDAAEEGEEGIEMGELGEAAETAGEVAEGLEAAGEGAELGGEVGAELGPLGALAGVVVGAGIGALFGLLDPPSSPKRQEEQPESMAEMREKLGEKTGIWSENTIIAQKRKFNVSRFKINQDQLALNAGEAPTNKPVYDQTPAVPGGD